MLRSAPAPRPHRPHFPSRKNFPAIARQSARLPCEKRRALFPDGPPPQPPAYPSKRKPLLQSRCSSLRWPLGLGRLLGAEAVAESSNFLLRIPLANRPAHQQLQASAGSRRSALSFAASTARWTQLVSQVCARWP